MDFFTLLQNFHLLRPYWLLAMIPLVLIIMAYARTQSQSRNWASIVDKRLLPHLLQGNTTNVKSAPLKSLLFFASLIIFALSGPVFEKRPQPVFKTQSALVIILDLSLSMDSTDIKPSRLSRAHFKINDILNQRKEGQTALIAYAADAYIVSPLTDDAQTIISQIPALETDIMPTQGSRLDIALNKASELFLNSGHSKGHIFIISDSINHASLNVIRDLKSSGIKTSVLAIGTKQGAPIAAKNGGFIKDDSGAIVVPKLDVNDMKHAAQTGGGQFSLITPGDKDINRLLSIIDENNAAVEQVDKEGNKYNTDVWHEEGPWLLLIIIPFAAYVFRKGLVFVFLLCVLIPLPQPAQAAGWSELWNNKDQLGEAALEQGNTEQAAELFKNPQWKAAAQYKSQQFEQAAQTLSNIDTPEANYNRGNALAKAGQYEAAISAYQRTLQQQADHEDAQHNLELLKQAQQDSENKQSKENQSEESQSSDKNSEDQQSEQGQGNSTDQQPSEQESNQNNSQSQNDQSQDNQSKEQQSQNSQNQDSQDEPSAEDQSSHKRDQEENTNQEENSPSQAEETDQAQEQTDQQADQATHDLSQQQTQQWLKKIPDDPAGLLRRKFKYQYGRDTRRTEQEQW